MKDSDVLPGTFPTTSAATEKEPLPPGLVLAIGAVFGLVTATAGFGILGQVLDRK